jgi:hypothetical protein
MVTWFREETAIQPRSWNGSLRHARSMSFRLMTKSFVEELADSAAEKYEPIRFLRD